MPRRFSKTRVICALAIVQLAIVGCFSDRHRDTINLPSSESSSEASAGATSASSTAPVTIVDRLNRTTRFDSAPRRIVSLSPATTELVFALGAGELLVGSTDYCDYPEQAKSIPRVGSGPLGTVSLEAIVGKQPDLVLCKFDTHQPLVESLERLNIAVVAVGPESLEEFFEEARWLGQALQRNEQAEQLIQSMTVRKEQLATKSSANRKLRVFYQVWNDPLMTAGKGSFINQLLELASLENIVDATIGRYPRVSPELVVERDPEIIIVPSSPANPVNLETIYGRPGWQGVSAVKNRRVLVVNSDIISRCGPRMLDALEQIIEAIQFNAGEKADDNAGEKTVKPNKDGTLSGGPP